MNVIQKKRKSINLTQEQLASRMGVNRSTVAKWESKNILPRNSKLPVLAEIFGCKIDDLFNKDDTDVGRKEETLCFMEKTK